MWWRSPTVVDGARDGTTGGRLGASTACVLHFLRFGESGVFARLARLRRFESRQAALIPQAEQ